MPTSRVLLLTLIALVAFAANSILYRLAFERSDIDAASFTAVRLLSGALASGAGYAVWHAALRGLAATHAATVQLAVPVIAAAGGIALVVRGRVARIQ